MNPPFDNGDKHLLKAISLLEEYGGQIVCLLNAETIKNPYSVYRMDLINKLEKYGADIEFISNGFSNAERKTDVEIAMIYLRIENRQEKSFILEKLEKAKKVNDVELNFREIVHNDFLKKIIEQYNFEISAGIKLIQEYNRISEITKSSFEDSYNYKILELSVVNEKSNLINNFIEKIRYKYWSTLFNNKDFNRYFTSEMKQEMNSRISEFKKYEFNEFNILELKNEMMSNIKESIEKTILKLFESLSITHSYGADYSKNIHYYNGWKSNNAYKINKKVVIPLKDTNWYRVNEFEFSDRIFSKLYDIEKVLNYFNDKEIESIDLEERLKQNLNAQNNKNIECKYFTVSFYKKGTCHLRFKDEELLLKFNIYGSQKKGWLPHNYGKKSYSELNDEEKEVIKEFHKGEKLTYGEIKRKGNIKIRLEEIGYNEKKGE